MNFEIEKLTAALKTACPEVVFALLHGSAKDGQVRQGGDIDIALYVEGKPKLSLYQQIYDANLS